MRLHFRGCSDAICKFILAIILQAGIIMKREIDAPW